LVRRKISLNVWRRTRCNVFLKFADSSVGNWMLTTPHMNDLLSIYIFKFSIYYYISDKERWQVFLYSHYDVSTFEIDLYLRTSSYSKKTRFHFTLSFNLRYL